MGVLKPVAFFACQKWYLDFDAEGFKTLAELAKSWIA